MITWLSFCLEFYWRELILIDTLYCFWWFVDAPFHDVDLFGLLIALIAGFVCWICWCYVTQGTAVG